MPKNPTDRCRNPWKKCDRHDIVVFIDYKGDELPICERCWAEIAVSDHEWGNDPKPKEPEKYQEKEDEEEEEIECQEKNGKSLEKEST